MLRLLLYNIGMNVAGAQYGLAHASDALSEGPDKGVEEALTNVVTEVIRLASA